MRRTLTLLLICAVLTASAAILVRPANCAVEAAVIGGPNWLSQYRLEVRQPLGCPQSWVRIRTRHGGVLPPIGYFKLGEGFPAYRSYLVFRGARVERRLAPNVWVPVPLKAGPSW